MSTDTIGASGADYTTIAAWATAVKAIGTLTEAEVGELIDDAAYAWSVKSDLDFDAVTLSGYTITLRGVGSGINDGDFGNGARVLGSTSYGILYEARNVIVEDSSYENTNANAWAVFGAASLTASRVLARCSTTSGGNGMGFEGLSGSAINLEACRAEAKVGFRLANAGCNVANCSAIGCPTGFDTTVANTGAIQNNVAYNCTTDYAGTWSGTNTNNASEDGTHPGTSGVTISGDPFDADGYTPAASGQLDGAGVNLSISLDAANNSFNATPSIGAYEVIAAAGGSPKGPFTHPLYGPFRGPIS